MLNLACHKDALGAPVLAAFIECLLRHSGAAPSVVRQFG